MNLLEVSISIFTIFAIGLHLSLRYLLNVPPYAWPIPLFAVLIFGGIPLVVNILRKLFAGEFGADLLAGISILTSALMGQYLVAAILVLMLSGGGALERFATKRASSVLNALAKRMPQKAHRKLETGMVDVRIDEIRIGDRLVVLPHEICPVDGTVTEGFGTMDESYLTGEPFEISKSPGSRALSGAINGKRALVIVATKQAADSRYASIMRVMEDTERNRPRLRRLGDRLAGWYTPLALAIAVSAWLAWGDSTRFLAVLVVATPCPLLIAIPVAVIGAISLSARRGIIIKNPSVLEQITQCRTVILDKTGTLTYGKPFLTEIISAPGSSKDETLRLVASLEQYSRHPLAAAVLKAATAAGLTLPHADAVGEEPGHGLSGMVLSHRVQVIGRKLMDEEFKKSLPPVAPGLECIVLIDGSFAAAFRFRDAPRPESGKFLAHLFPTHQVNKIMLVSGDREEEVRYLAKKVGITHIAAEKSPEEKVRIVIEETKNSKTLFVGDGINDAPALTASTVGVAIGHNSDITSEAAGAVILTASIAKLDELMHIGDRMRIIALESAVGGMMLSLIGMLAAAIGHLSPLQGAVAQELIDLAAVLNAVRVAWPPRKLTDF